MNEPHPAANLLPMLDGEAFELLKQDIAQNGQQQPILIYEWQIVDGRSRFLACKELGINPTYQFIAEDPVGAMWEANKAHKGRMNKSQRAIVALRALPILEAEIRARPNPPLKPKTEAMAEVNRIFGASKTQVGEARQVQHESPQMFAEVEAGRLSLNKAAQRLRHQAKQLDTPTMGKKIRELANEGYRAAQISEALGLKVVRVKQLAREYQIALPDDRQLRHAAGIKVKDMIDNTITGLEGYASGLEAVNGVALPFTPDEAQELVVSLAQSLKPIQRLRRQLLEIANAKSEN